MNIDFHVHGLLSKRKDFNENVNKDCSWSIINFKVISSLNGIKIF